MIKTHLLQMLFLSQPPDPSSLEDSLSSLLLIVLACSATRPPSCTINVVLYILCKHTVCEPMLGKGRLWCQTP